MKLLAGVELGGTKCVCILGTGPLTFASRYGFQPASLSRRSPYVVPPKLGATAGPMGALLLANEAAAPTAGHVRE